MSTAIEVAEKIKHHTAFVSPGQPASLTSAHQVGDGIWQGDLGIEIVSAIPSDYMPVIDPTDSDRQLVPEGGAGSHHRLASLDGVSIFRPVGWGKTRTDLRGPCVVFAKPNAIVHEPGHANPHGKVTIAAPMIVRCRYQRNLNQEQREQRAAD